MSKQELVSNYSNYIKEFNSDIIHEYRYADLSHYEAEFPSNLDEMEAFICAFNNIFPHTTHDFSRYNILLSGLTKMEEDNEFKDTEVYLDIVDYIREEALEELQDQISKYPLLEDIKLFDFKSYIEEINEDLGFDGVNSEVNEEGIGTNRSYQVLIEGKNYTTLQIILDIQDLEKHLKYKILKRYILEAYESAIVNFNVDEVFDELYDAVKSSYRASEFLNMLQQDKSFFTDTIKSELRKLVKKEG